MLRRLNLLGSRHSIVLHLEKSIFPIVIQPLGEPTTTYHGLSQSLFSHSHKKIPFSLSNFQEQKQEQVVNSQSETEAKVVQTTQSEKGKEKEKINYKLYIKQNGKVIEGTQASEQSDIPFAILSQPLGTRKVVGVQTKWQYFSEKIIKMFTYYFITNIFFICFVISRPQNKEKSWEQLKQLRRFF